MLHKVTALLGYHVVASDGAIGHVDDVLVDDNIAMVRYLVVDTSNWIGGKSVLLSATTVDRVDSPARKVEVKLTRDQIKGGPSLETAQIDSAETLPALWIM
jgi:sporulation protein YlmC with PRC-barrel domain